MKSLISIGQIIDTAVDHYRKHGKELLGIALWILVAFIPLGAAGLFSPAQEADYAALSTGKIALIGIVNFLGVIAVTVVSLWVAISLILMISAQYSGKNVDATTVGKQAWRLFVPFSILSVMVAIAVAVPALLAAPGLIMMFAGAFTDGSAVAGSGMLLFAAGAIVGTFFLIKFSVEFSFSQYELVLEGKGKLMSWKALWGAMKESRALVKNRWWATLWRLMLPNILFSLAVFVVNMIITLGAGVLLAASASAVPEIALKLGAVIISFATVGVNVLAAPLYTIATYALYDSLVATRERS